jgi:surface antigen
MMTMRTMFAALLAASVAGCAADPYAPKQNTGAVAGAVAGGALGAILGGRGAGSRIAGAAIGAAGGALLGGAIGASMDEEDRQRAYAAEMEALEYGQPGAPVGWRSQRTAYYGTIVPGPYMTRGGLRCRDYSHTIYINGRPEIARGTACRNPDGTWSPVG